MSKSLLVYKSCGVHIKHSYMTFRNLILTLTQASRFNKNNKEHNLLYASLLYIIRTDTI